MPIHNTFVLDQQGQPSPEGLRLSGPLLPVEISIHPTLAHVLQTQGQLIPAPVTGQGLIDTGAGVTAVDVAALSQLQIQPVGSIMVGTAGGQQPQQQFPASISFPGTQFPVANFTFVIGSNLAGQGIIALIGRDVLRHFLLVYNGVMGQVILSM